MKKHIFILLFTLLVLSVSIFGCEKEEAEAVTIPETIVEEIS